MQFVLDTSVSTEVLWQEFVHEYAIIPVLAHRHHLSASTIQRRLHAYEAPPVIHEPCTMVAVMDATKVHTSWVLAVRDPHKKKTIYAEEISSETTFQYQIAHERLTARGYTFSAIVSDGRFVAVKWLFPGIPIQMCHYHQIQIIIGYLTFNPKLKAGIELLHLVRTLPRNDEASFTDAFKLWCRTYHDFLQEKTLNTETGRSHWTHKRLRQARDSIAAHLEFLFTFQRYPELTIPNTTNSLDGSFKKAKVAIAVHSGLTLKQQIKLVLSVLFSHQ